LRKIRRARYLANLLQSRWDESADEHEAIMTALLARKGRDLGKILCGHSRRTGVIVIAAVKAQYASTAEPEGPRGANNPALSGQSRP
jgi:DNA-binding GntR family transcriptional regulator